MTDNITAEIVSIGTEILLGELTDTNSVYVARAFRDIGINVFFMTSVGDNRKRIADAVRIALSRADIVITTGGLGPTVDDMTRHGVADATNRELSFHQVLLDQITERFRSFQVTMTENNRRQAYLPDSAKVIENPVGTAPSFIVEHEDKIVISLPGVPREMKFLMRERVIPFLLERYGLGIIKSRILHAAGIGESSLDDMLGHSLLEQNNPTVGLAAHSGQIDIRITAKADTEEQATALIDRTEKDIQHRVGRYIYGSDDDTLQQVLKDQLYQQHKTLLICEAGITIDVYSDDVIRHIVYADPDALRKEYYVDMSTSLRDLVTGVARQLKEQYKDDIVLVTASLPDVDEAEDKAESTAVTILDGENIRTRVYGFGARSELARQWVSTWAMSSAWWMLKEMQKQDD